VVHVIAQENSQTLARPAIDYDNQIRELKLILQFSLAMSTLDLSYQYLIHIAFIIIVIFPQNRMAKLVMRIRER